MNCTDSSFLKDIVDYVMTVIHDDGFNRHIQFKIKGIDYVS